MSDPAPRPSRDLRLDFFRGLAFLAADALPEDPDLVLWQVGTNDVLHDIEPDDLRDARTAGEIRTDIG